MRAVLMVLCLLCAGASAKAWTHGNTGYVGNIVTRAGVESELDSTNTEAMAETWYYVRGAHTNPQFIFANFYANANGSESAPGTSATITASVEYPPGTCTQIKWSGSASLTVASGALAAASDAVSLSLPDGARIGVRLYVQSTGGIVYAENETVPAVSGDELRVGTSGISDQTTSCDTITGNTDEGFIPANAIIAQTTSPSVCIVGDSIAHLQDDNGTVAGDIEVIARSLGPTIAYIHIDRPSTTAEAFVQPNASAQRQKLFQYCSHVIVEYGINDFAIPGESATVAQLQGYLTTIYGYAAPNTTIFQTTLTPYTTSTDNWATTANQSPEAWESKRVSFNDQLRAGTFGPNGGYFDQAQPAETSADSGIWKAGASFPQCTSPNYWTTDGVHFDTCAAAFGAASGVINTSRIHYP